VSHHCFIVGHVLEVLQNLSDESVHCVLPPGEGGAAGGRSGRDKNIFPAVARFGRRRYIVQAGKTPGPQLFYRRWFWCDVLLLRRKFDVPGTAAAKSAQLAELVASRVARRWSDCLVFLAGGGATLVQGAVSRLAKCEVLPDSQFANAAGFLAKGLVAVLRGKAGNGGD